MPSAATAARSSRASHRWWCRAHRRPAGRPPAHRHRRVRRPSPPSTRSRSPAASSRTTSGWTSCWAGRCAVRRHLRHGPVQPRHPPRPHGQDHRLVGRNRLGAGSIRLHSGQLVRERPWIDRRWTRRLRVRVGSRQPSRPGIHAGRQPPSTIRNDRDGTGPVRTCVRPDGGCRRQRLRARRRPAQPEEVLPDRQPDLDGRRLDRPGPCRAWSHRHARFPRPDRPRERRPGQGRLRRRGRARSSIRSTRPAATRRSTGKGTSTSVAAAQHSRRSSMPSTA